MCLSRCACVVRKSGWEERKERELTKAAISLYKSLEGFKNLFAEQRDIKHSEYASTGVAKTNRTFLLPRHSSTANGTDISGKSWNSDTESKEVRLQLCSTTTQLCDVQASHLTPLSLIFSCVKCG